MNIRYQGKLLGKCLVGVRETAHATHDAEHVVVGRVDTHLSRGGTLDGRVREHKLEGSVVDSGEVACARRLVLLRAQGEGVHVDARVRGAGVGEERLHQVEVGPLTLREPILSVELELGGDHRVLSPAVLGQGALRQHEGSGVRHVGLDSDISRGQLPPAGVKLGSFTAKLGAL